MEREEAIRLRLENEKLQQENAHLRELLDIVHPPAPIQTTTAGRLAPDRAPQCIGVDALRVSDGDRLRDATANGLWADDGARLRASGDAGRDDRLRAAANSAALRHESLLRCRVAQLERQVCRAEAQLQRRRGFAAETERALKEMTQRLGKALPEEDAPDAAWSGAVDQLTGLRDWGRGMLCRLRDMRCCTEPGPAGAEACERIEKEHSVAWSVPYFIPGGSEFVKENAQPPTTVRGLCIGEGTLLADPAQVHALESQLALLAPDLAAAADTLRSLILPNLACLAPTLASDIKGQMRRLVASLVSASTKLCSLACLLPMPVPNLTDISTAPPHIQARLGERGAAGQQMVSEHGSAVFNGRLDAAGSNSGTCGHVQTAGNNAAHLQSLLGHQVKHCSDVLQSVKAALTTARQQHEEPVAQACAAVEAVAAAHSHLQARPASEVCMVRLLKELSLHADKLTGLPQLLTNCLNSSQEALKQVQRESYLTRNEALSLGVQTSANNDLGGS
ncbi:g5473 [Coccomyxa elongata]